MRISDWSSDVCSSDLKRAVASIREDMGHVVVAGAIEVDLGGLGPSITRNRAVVQTMNAGVRPKWIAFLDDDDEFLPDHLRKLVEHAEATDADVVYPWFELNVGGRVDNAKGDNLLLVNGKTAFGQPLDRKSTRMNSSH